MTVVRGLRAKALVGAAVAVCAALTMGTGTANAAASCEGQTSEQPFLRFLDPLPYTPVPGGSFEGAHGWQLSGGARVVSGNEPFYVAGRTHQRSLFLPPDRRRRARPSAPASCTRRCASSRPAAR